jgi:hypothetical protein
MINLADIAGASTTVQLSATNITARWVQAIVTGAGTARFGGSTVTASLGLPVATGGGFFFPPVIEFGGGVPYSLASIYAYIPAGATVSIAYEPWN